MVKNTSRSGVTNSNNASQSYLGKEAPTSFYNGKTIYQQLTITSILVKNIQARQNH